MKTQDLEINVTDGVLCISIGVETLCNACETGRAYGLEGIKITDKEAFVNSLAVELGREGGDDTTPVHEMFDRAVSEMLENGEEGVEAEDEEL